jgi:hypothetical protein
MSPSGAAGPPPTWLASTSPPIEIIDAGTKLFRVHRKTLDPIFYGPGPGAPPTFRFDSASGRFGVLYIALAPAGAIVETLLRSPERHSIAMDAIAARALSVLTCETGLRLVPLSGSNLQKLGVDNSITTGPYGPCGLWSDALFDHRDAPDGVIYPSRHNPDERCIALFERPGRILRAAPKAPLDKGATAKIVADVLKRHGKSIAL